MYLMKDVEKVQVFYAGDITLAKGNYSRFFSLKPNKENPGRPHVYEDPNHRTFRRSNSGSFNRAPRFKSPLDSGTINAYLL